MERTRPAGLAPTDADFLAGGGEIGALMRGMDWSQTALGAPQTWPQSLKTLVSVLLNSQYPMFVFWGPKLIKIYNDAYRPITGDKHPWALGRAAPEVWPEIWDDISPLVERALQGEATWSDDLMLFMHRHGYPEEVYFTFSYSPIRDESGGVGGMFCACTETTSEVLGDRRLRTLRDLAAAPAEARTVRAAYEQSMEVLARNAADIPFALLYLLDEAGETAELAASIGVEPGASVSPSTVPRAEAGGWPIFDVATSGKPQVMEDLARRFDALPQGPWPEPVGTAVVQPVMGREQRRSLGVLVLGASSRRALDEDYRSFFDLVVNQVAASIANARASEDERRRAETLAELDRAKTAFFSNVSHEFRTPLTLMMSPLEELLAVPDEERLGDRRHLIDVAHRNSQRLLRLVNTLLDFSRVEAGRMKAVYVPTDLARLTGDLVSNFRSLCERAGIRLEVECDELPEAVYVDREMWEKIVLNLMSNAFKFTLEGAIAVALRVQEGEAVLTVTDSGVGIPRGELPHLFDRFHRVESTLGRSHEGSGIGLALVQELVKLHGGRIVVESEVGRGTRFTVSIPLGQAHLPAEHVSAEHALKATTERARAFVEEAWRWLPGVSLGDAALPAPSDATPANDDHAAARPRVLWADDNADMRNYVRRLLAEFYDVQVVNDGEAALAAARARPPDLILSDVMMPRLDGFGLLTALRADERTRDLPIVLVSARAGEEAEVEGLEAGADDYLVKPFTARELLARVRATIDLARERRRRTVEVAAWRDRYEIAVRASGHLLYDWDSQTGEMLYGGDLTSILGYSAEEMGNRLERWYEIIHPDEVDLFKDEIARVVETGGRFRLDFRVLHKDGHYIDVEDDGYFVRDPDGGTKRMIGFVRNVTERKRAEERQLLLMREIDHRAKNLLATIQAMVIQTARTKDEISEFVEAIQHRIQAMASVHDLLSTSRWQGAGLRALVMEELAPFVDEGRVAKMGGPDLVLKPNTAMSLCLVVHELVTNAAKYGALSVPEGRVELTWRQDDDGGIVVQWLESNGPLVRRPKHKGFGSRLIESSLGATGGKAQLRFERTGLKCTIHLSAQEIVTPTSRPSSSESKGSDEIAPAAPRTVPPKARSPRVLVVEDNALVALHVQSLFERLGYEVLGPAATLEEAMDLAGRRPFDGAVLDIDLNGKTVLPLAKVLRERGVPLIFASGYDSPADDPQTFSDVVVVRKPFDETELARAVQRIVPIGDDGADR